MAAKLHDSVALDLDRGFRDNYWKARQDGRVVDVEHGDSNLVYVDWGSDGRELHGANMTDRPERWNVGLLRVTYPAPALADDGRNR